MKYIIKITWMNGRVAYDCDGSFAYTTVMSLAYDYSDYSDASRIREVWETTYKNVRCADIIQAQSNTIHQIEELVLL